eukprot:761369-Hanusia_phi.AAC.12
MQVASTAGRTEETGFLRTVTSHEHSVSTPRRYSRGYSDSVQLSHVTHDLSTHRGVFTLDPSFDLTQRGNEGCVRHPRNQNPSAPPAGRRDFACGQVSICHRLGWGGATWT